MDASLNIITTNPENTHGQKFGGSSQSKINMDLLFFIKKIMEPSEPLHKTSPERFSRASLAFQSLPPLQSLSKACTEQPDSLLQSLQNLLRTYQASPSKQPRRSLIRHSPELQSIDGILTFNREQQQQFPINF